MPDTLLPRATALAPDEPTWIRRLALLVGLALAVALLVGLAVLERSGQPLLTAAATRLPCVSYAPFRRPGHTPFDAARVVSPAEIEEDLARLRQVTGCVRTYGVDHGLDAVPAIAGRLGLRVALGAWIGRDPVANAQQVDRAVALAHEHPGVVERLVIGNEVLLRRELTAPALAGWLARARRDAPVPVTYADVWEFWERHADVLRPHVDLVAIHVLPYWEDDPVGIRGAVDHVHAVTARLRDRFAPQAVWVAETGWPAAGRQRGAAAPGRVEQAHFVRELLAREAADPLSFNLIEGFDQPWKRALEGAMGGAWGVFDAAGHPRVPLTGPLPPDRARAHVGAAALIGFGCGFALWVAPWVVRRNRRRRGEGVAESCAEAGPSPARHGRQLEAFVLLVLSGTGLGVLTLLQAEAAVTWSRTPVEWAVAIAWSALSLLVGLEAVRRLADRLAGTATSAARPGAMQALGPRDLAGPAAAGPGHPQLSAMLLLALLFVTAMHALWLVFDGRYRALAWPFVVGPAIALAARAWLGDRLRADAVHERLLAAVLAGAALALVALEGVSNTPALVTAAAWLVLAGGVAWRPGADRSSGVGAGPGRAQDTPGHQAGPPRDGDARGTIANAASSAAGADRLAL